MLVFVAAGFEAVAAPAKPKTLLAPAAGAKGSEEAANGSAEETANGSDPDTLLVVENPVEVAKGSL